MISQKFKFQLAIIEVAVSTGLILFGLNTELQAKERSHFITNSSLLSAEPENSVDSNISAIDFFRKVYQNRYTWDNEFPGYTAAVEFKQNKSKYKGYIRVDPDLRTVEITGINNEEAIQTIKNQLLMLTVHRRQIPFETAHKNKTFKFASTESNGIREIIEEGGKAPARYQVANNQIVQVTRLLGPQSVIVKTLNAETTPEGYIATKYQSTFYDAKTNQLIGSEVSEDTYKKIGKYYLPIRQVIQHTEVGDEFEAEFNFTEIKLTTRK